MDRRRVPVGLVDQPPLRIRTAYAYFVKDNYRRLREEVGTRKSPEIFRALGQEWRNMGIRERAPYRNQEMADRRRYEAAKADWFVQFHGRIPPKLQRRKPKDAPVRKRNPKDKEESKEMKASESKRSRRGG